MPEQGIGRRTWPYYCEGINATLKSALSTAKRWQYVDRNVAKDATPPKQVKYKAHPLTPEQAERLLAIVAGHRYEAIHYLGLMMGLRREEVCGLQWPDIDFEKAVMHIRNALQRITGKGLVLMNVVKTEDSEAFVPIPRLCLDALLRRQAIQQQEQIKAGEKWKQDMQFVFTSRYGPRIVIEELTRELNVALDLAKLPHVRFHDLRHSTASFAAGQTRAHEGRAGDHAPLQFPDHHGHIQPSAAERA